MSKMNLIDPQELLLLLKKNNFQAFEVLMNRYSYELYKYAAKAIGNKEDAEDIVQELFLELWDGRQSLLIHTTLDAYLFGVLKKKLLRRYRDKGIEQKHLKLFGEMLSEYSDATMKLVISNDLMENFEERLQVLPRREKEVFILSQIEGYSVKEIALRLQTSEQTVRNQINSASRKVNVILSRLLN